MANKKDITDALNKEISSTTDDEVEKLEALYKAREKLEKLMKQSYDKNDSKRYMSAKRQLELNNKYIKNLELQIKAQQELSRVMKAGQQPTEKMIKSYEDLTKRVEEDTVELDKNIKKIIERREESKRAAEQYEAERIKEFKQYTTTGRILDFLSAKTTKLAEDFTFSALAVKSFNRHIEATNLRQNILIKTSKGLGGEVGKSFGRSAVEIEKFDEELAKTKAHAKYFGIAVEEVNGGMERLAYITGIESVESLGTLTRGALSVSKALGISTAEAIDFVSLRMEKFGGSASGAIVTMNQMREESEKINISFGRTVIRGGDLVKSLMDISRQTNIYAIDQRFVGNILRESVARLQSMGDSYEAANKKAMTFAKGLTGEAPDWMKVYSGEDMLKQFTDAFGDGGAAGVAAFEKRFKAELDAAKPGLSDEIISVLKDPKMGYYSKIRYMSDAVGATSIGIEAMNKQILKVAQNPQGIAIIAEMWHISHVEARAMVDQAKDFQEKMVIVNGLSKARNVNEAMIVANKYKELKITKAEIEATRTRAETETDAIKKAAMIQTATETLVSRKRMMLTVERDAKRKEDEKKRNKEMAQKIQEDIEFYKKEQKKTTDAGVAEQYEEQIKRAQEEVSRLEGREEDKDKASAGLKNVEEINAKHLDLFDNYSKHTLTKFTSILEELKTAKMLLFGAIVAGFAGVMLKQKANAAIEGIIKNLAIKRGGIIAEGVAGKVVAGGANLAKGGIGGASAAGMQTTFEHLSDITTKSAGEIGTNVGKEVGKEVGEKAIKLSADITEATKATGEVAKATGAGAKAATAGSKAMGGLSKILSKVTKGIPILSAGVSFASSKMAGESTGKAASGAAGSFAGGLLGAKAGAIIGTAILPGFGTAVGGLLGSIIGAMGGDKLFKWVYDKFISGASWDGFLDSIIRPIVKFGFWVGDLVKGAWDSIKNGFSFLTGLAEKIQKEGAGFIWDAIMEGVKSIGKGIVRIFTKGQEVYAEESKKHNDELLAKAAEKGKLFAAEITQKSSKEEVKKTVAEYTKKTPISNVQISKLPDSATAQQQLNQTTKEALKLRENTVPEQTTASTTQSLQATGTGSFISVNPDGSSTLRAEITINNHMAAVAQANTMMKQNSIRGPLG